MRPCRAGLTPDSMEAWLTSVTAGRTVCAFPVYAPAWARATMFGETLSDSASGRRPSTLMMRTRSANARSSGVSIVVGVGAVGAAVCVGDASVCAWAMAGVWAGAVAVGRGVSVGGSGVVVGAGAAVQPARSRATSNRWGIASRRGVAEEAGLVHSLDEPLVEPVELSASE